MPREEKKIKQVVYHIIQGTQQVPNQHTTTHNGQNK
jgi:hypothetical protein